MFQRRVGSGNPYRTCSAAFVGAVLRRLLPLVLAVIGCVTLLDTPSTAQSPVLQVLGRHVRPAVSDHRAAFARRLPLDQKIHANIVLKLRNQTALTSLLARLYDSSSPDYRHFLTVEQFTEQFSPTQKDIDAVVAFARTNGLIVSDIPTNRLIVPVTGTVAQINTAFNVQMSVYRHPTENRTFFSPDREPSLSLGVPVAHISGLDNYSLPRHMQATQTGHQAAIVTGSGPSGSYLGSDMRTAYYGGTTLNGNGQTVGLLEFDGYDINDVNLTFSNAGQTYNVPINNVLMTNASAGSDGDDSEQTLDIVQAIGMAPGLSQVRVYIGVGQDDPAILNSMASENIAKQISCSWGWEPADPTTDDVFFQEMAAQGQTFLTASGDYGAYDAVVSPYFYPADDQYVTAVGGTHLMTNGSAGPWVSETVWNSRGDGSGGGISPDGISMPGWQFGLATTANGGSSTLRNVPDVAMEADFDNYFCAGGNCYTDGAGTSFATPRWAGFLAMINQQAVEAGNAPGGGVGFINPAVYTLAQGPNASADFHDITVGNNDTSNQPVYFNAEPGYDLTTGWGSANGQSLINDLAGPQVPGFWLASSQATIGLNPGGTASATVSITDAGGFNGNVTLAVASPLPTGVTASFATNPTTATSLLTLTAGSSAAAASQIVTITGTSGTLTASTNVTVAVHTPTFTLSAYSAVSINPGGTATPSILVVPQYGFAGSVNLSVSGLPAGVTASFSPSSTTGSSTLNLSVSTTAAMGTSMLTVTGTSGSLTATTNIALTIVGPSFVLYNLGNVNIGQGSSGGAYVEVYGLSGFTGSVNLVASGLPSGVTASISPNPTTELSTVSFTASAAAAVGQYVVTITGTSGNLTASTTIKVGVFAPTFTLQNSALNLVIGTTASASVSVFPQYGFSGSVLLSLSGLPAGVTALVSPNPTTSSSTLSFAASNSAKPGQYTITVTGVSGAITEKTTFNLSVYAPSFTIAQYSGGVSMGQGMSTSTYIYITPQYGFTGSVNMAVSGLPNGVTASFAQNPATQSTLLTLNASSTATIGQYTLTVTGTSGTQTATTTLSLGVYQPTFTLYGSGNVSLGQGTSTFTFIEVSPQYGFSGAVSLSISGLPSGVTASFSANPVSGYGSSTITLTASGTAALGQYPLTVKATSGMQTVTTTLTLGIYQPTFTIYSSGSVSVGQGNSASTYVDVNAQYGLAGSVTMSVSGLPSGVTATFSPNPSTGYSTLLLTASSTAAIGQYTLTITGTSGTQTATTTLNLAVFVPAFTLSGPYSVTTGQGTTANSYLYVNSQYGFSGNVTLSVSGLPTGVTASFSPNPTTYYSYLTLNVGASAPIGISTVTITGTSGAQTATTTFQLMIGVQGFTISPSSSTVTLNEGSSANTYLYINSQNGFAGSVSLSAAGLPSGVTASFSPNPTTYFSDVTLSANSTAAPGTYTVTLNGTSGSLSASTTFSLTINTPTFAISASPSVINLIPGATQKSTLSPVATNGFSGSVTYSASGLPSGVTASFAPNPASGSSVLTITASSTASPTTATITITGTSGATTATTTLPITIRSAPVTSATTLAFTSAGSPVSSVASGTAVTATVTVTAGSTPLTAGQVNICAATAVLCDVAHLLGSAQLTAAGTATFTFIPGEGGHSYSAVFAGTTNYASSTSAATGIAATASLPTTTTIAQSGSSGNYTLTTTVTGKGAVPPSGSVSFLDTSDGNFSLGAASLGGTTSTLGFNVSQSSLPGTSSASTATGDFNGDGIPDLAVPNNTGNSITVLLGNGDGTFHAVNSVLTGNSPNGIAVGDFNRDGRLDLAVTLAGSYAVDVFLGNGDGTFVPSGLSPQVGSSPSSVSAADYNNDGILDLAVVTSGNVTILLGNGDGTFTPSVGSTSVGLSSSIVHGDLNGDGIQDLAVTNINASSITVLLGNGDGTFSTAGTQATGYDPVSLAIGDLNGDGKLDLVVSNQFGYSLTVLLGNGDGTFTPAPTISVNGFPGNIAVADLNNDGKPDLLVSASSGYTALVLFGNGDGTFIPGPTQQLGNYTNAMVLGDWNGDGIPDAVFAGGSTANTLTVLTSQLTQVATGSSTGISPLGTGQHLIAASYPGDSVYSGSLSSTTSLTAQAGAPKVTVSLSTTTLTTVQPLTVTISVNAGSANPVPTGSVQLTSGSYNSGTTVLNNGTATITVPAGTLPLGIDTVSATFVPDPASSSRYLQATGSSTVKVGLVTPNLTITPVPASPTFAQSLTVTLALSGGAGTPLATGSITLSGGSYTATLRLSAGSATAILPAGSLPTGIDSLTANYTPDTASSGVYSATTGSVLVTVAQAVPVLTWPAPATIIYGTALTAIQLDATSSVPGTFVYTPALGTILKPGAYQTLSVSFTPTDTTNYTAATAAVTIGVINVNSVPFVFIAGSSEVASLNADGTPATLALAGGGAGEAVDANGNVWSIGGGNSLAVFSSAGTLSTTYTNLGLSGATSLAIDGNSQVWVTNGNGTLTVLSNTGAIVAATPGSSVTAASAITVDLSGNVWVANPSAGSVDEIIGAAGPVAPIANAVQNKTLGAKP